MFTRVQGVTIQFFFGTGNYLNNIKSMGSAQYNSSLLPS